MDYPDALALWQYYKGPSTPPSKAQVDFLASLRDYCEDVARNLIYIFGHQLDDALQTEANITALERLMPHQLEQMKLTIGQLPKPFRTQANIDKLLARRDKAYAITHSFNLLPYHSLSHLQTQENLDALFLHPKPEVLEMIFSICFALWEKLLFLEADDKDHLKIKEFHEFCPKVSDLRGQDYFDQTLAMVNFNRDANLNPAKLPFDGPALYILWQLWSNQELLEDIRGAFFALENNDRHLVKLAAIINEKKIVSVYSRLHREVQTEYPSLDFRAYQWWLRSILERSARTSSLATLYNFGARALYFRVIRDMLFNEYRLDLPYYRHLQSVLITLIDAYVPKVWEFNAINRELRAIVKPTLDRKIKRQDILNAMLAEFKSSHPQYSSDNYDQQIWNQINIHIGLAEEDIKNTLRAWFADWVQAQTRLAESVAIRGTAAPPIATLYLGTPKLAAAPSPAAPPPP